MLNNRANGDCMYFRESTDEARKGFGLCNGRVDLDF